MTQSTAETNHNLLPSRAAQKNHTAAQQAIRHVRGQLPRRAAYRRLQPALDVDRNHFPHWILGRLDQVWRLTGELEGTQQGLSDRPTELLAYRLAREAVKTGTGTAAEQAIIAFAYLMHVGVRPLDFMHSTGREHVFVLVGRMPPSSVTHDPTSERKRDASVTTDPVIEITPEMWGADAVVCDPARGVIHRQGELINTEYYYDYYPSESQLHIPPAAGAAFDT